MENRKDKIKKLGRLLTQKDKIDGAVRVLEQELGMVGISDINPELPLTKMLNASAQAIQKTAPSPRKESAEGAVAPLPKPKSAARAKQGQYMGLLRSLPEPDQRLVKAAKESGGIDDALALAKRLRGKAVEKAIATVPTDEQFGDEFPDI